MANKQTQMEFTIKGWLYDHITLTWKNGKLFGDHPEILEIIQTRVQQLEKVKAMILCKETHQYFTENYLQQPLSAFIVIQNILEEIYESPSLRDILQLNSNQHSNPFTVGQT
ncbi:hypothetical protein [Hazenella coriacea]|uniref:Uncharacterized protein n=1 Tax=Hazenella coriacea TaxID=1179467 RepID=A0A4R3LAW0_9BACL|nr:hypothetical protein [Hazenella coriacea]TCS96889.1 hypothetical protein EDD58_101534 [Hazenella coriacea]